MIISVQTSLRSAPIARSPDQVLSLAIKVTRDLAALHPLMKRWYALPPGPAGRYVSLDDTDTLVSQMERGVENLRRQFGDFDSLGASLILSNVDNDRDWRKPGVVVLRLNPRTGASSIRLVGLDPFGEAVPSVFLNALIALVGEVRPAFACTDVKAKSPEKGLVTYQLDRRLYQHREYLGWMGFIPAQLTHPQIRDAHAVYPVDGLGTVIVSVPGVFDPCDDAQVDKVHRVEMDLASYDLLPVTDPNLGR